MIFTVSVATCYCREVNTRFFQDNFAFGICYWAQYGFSPSEKTR